jgi:hypothetical protein
MSDTPETDAAWKGNDTIMQLTTSRRLERERDEARAELIQLQALELNNEGACVRLKRQRDEARALAAAFHEDQTRLIMERQQQKGQP